MRNTAVAALAALALATPALSAGFDFPPRGLDDAARELLATKAPVGAVAACAARFAAESFRGPDLTARRRNEDSMARMVAVLPEVAERTGVPRQRAAAVLALAMLPVATASIGLMPPGAASGDGGDATGCASIAADPGAYAAGLGQRPGQAGSRAE